jgi:hypothetical protein
MILASYRELSRNHLLRIRTTDSPSLLTWALKSQAPGQAGTAIIMGQKLVSRLIIIHDNTGGKGRNNSDPGRLRNSPLPASPPTHSPTTHPLTQHITFASHRIAYRITSHQPSYPLLLLLLLLLLSSFNPPITTQVSFLPWPQRIPDPG